VLISSKCLKAWGKVAELPAGDRVVFLGEQGEAFAERKETLVQALGVLDAPL
jgi:hypothetical protein